MKLSILIPTCKKHSTFFVEIYFELQYQRNGNQEIEIVVDGSDTDTIGTKRNHLLQRAKGEYVCFFDSDDFPRPTYIQRFMEGVESGLDCASLKGLYCIDYEADGIFEHSIKYKEWKTTTNEIKYERYPNHLNLIRASIAKQFKFPETNHGEDHDWSTQIHKSGLLKTEFYIPEILYYYLKRTNHV